MTLDDIRYDRVPAVLTDELTNVTASSTTQFSTQDLTNDSGYDFVVTELGFHADGQEAAAGVATVSRPDAWSIRVTDLSRNIQWMKDFVRVACLIEMSGTTNIGNKWHLGAPCVLPPKSSLKIEVTNNDTGTPDLRIAIIGYYLVPVIPGTPQALANDHYYRSYGPDGRIADSIDAAGGRRAD